VPDKNGAGIRLEADNLTIRNCSFLNNENGVLTANSGRGTIRIENSIFGYNGSGDGYSHNIYIGLAEKFELRGSYIHHARAGHNIKTRARNNTIEYNYISDGVDGESSYLVDLPDGGVAILLGNVLEQGPSAHNSTMVSYGAEGLGESVNALFLINNTFVNHRHSGIFLGLKRSPAESLIANNIFAGRGKSIENLRPAQGNLFKEKLRFLDPSAGDFRLEASSPVLDQGIASRTLQNRGLLPIYEYVHPAQTRARLSGGLLDTGAYEHNPQP
jgi:hypothetical protein